MKDNRELVRQCVDIFNRRDIEAASPLFAEDLINHAAIPESQGRKGLFGIWEKMWTAFPDLAWTCEDMIAEGNRVVCRVRMRGTNSGPLRFVRMPLPATGKTFDSEGIYIFRVAGGQIAEVWLQRDEIGMLRQLGHFTMGAAKT